VVDGNRVSDWQAKLKEKLNSTVDFCVLIVPGKKGKTEIYDKLKTMLLS